ncbi:hypothetical protein LOR37_14975 [Clostridium estertheticum]|uniref:hypothetical protein n=1 Tax=Clostridium estertheticum TaxID=238834 RepID=UPI0022DE3669|nr:hypothetical protein [Clostridium estertheticum]WBL45980.1 hypothetical protein LOR37_14975 [Clostridium estertheticum]
MKIDNLILIVVTITMISVIVVTHGLNHGVTLGAILGVTIIVVEKNIPITIAIKKTNIKAELTFKRNSAIFKCK